MVFLQSLYEIGGLEFMEIRRPSTRTQDLNENGPTRVHIPEPFITITTLRRGRGIPTDISVRQHVARSAAGPRQVLYETTCTRFSPRPFTMRPATLKHNSIVLGLIISIKIRLLGSFALKCRLWYSATREVSGSH